MEKVFPVSYFSWLPVLSPKEVRQTDSTLGNERAVCLLPMPAGSLTVPLRGEMSQFFSKPVFLWV